MKPEWNNIIATLLDMVGWRDDIWMFEKSTDDNFLDTIQYIIDVAVLDREYSVWKADTVFAEVSHPIILLCNIPKVTEFFLVQAGRNWLAETTHADRGQGA